MATPPPAAPLAPPPIAREDITGVVLAGGRGSRMGGVDKGLQNHQGLPLALHALLRLGPQVGSLMLNANRNLAAYEAMGVPVWPDALPGHPGPLAGFLTALERCETPYLATVPCDSPHFPADLVERLAAGLVAEGAEIAMAATRLPPDAPPDAEDAGSLAPPGLQLQPVFCLIGAPLLESLVTFLQTGRRRIDRWTAQHRCALVVFDEAEAFANANTADELQRLQQAARRPG